MKLIPIFVHRETSEGLYSIHFDDIEMSEFERLFEFWSDAEYVTDYFTRNSAFLDCAYFSDISPDKLITKVLNEAEELSNQIEDYCSKGFEHCGDNLQMIFKPLAYRDNHSVFRQRSKLKVLKPGFSKPILRIYALRIEENTFVITGGAIKLTKYMDEHPDTEKELKKVELVKRFLLKNDIDCVDDIIYYYENLKR